MAFVQELFEIVMKAKPWTIVNEYEGGLYFWCGDVVNWRMPDYKLKKVLKRRSESTHGTKITLDEIIKQEKEMNANYKSGTITRNKLFDDGWRRYKWLGKWEHPERYSKTRPPGAYLHIPALLDFSRVEPVNITDIVKELKFVAIFNRYGKMSTLVLDGCNGDLEKHIKTMHTLYDARGNPYKKYADMDIERGTALSISGFVRYEIEDPYKAYTQVTDWEKSYQSLVLMMFTKYSREMTVDDWFNPKKVEQIEAIVKNKMNERKNKKSGTGGSVAREEWGIWTSEFVLTDISPRSLQRYAQELYVPDEGLKLKLNAKIET